MEKYVTFIGQGRSGHTIVSAILDSHPNARISEEQKYIHKWYMQNWQRKQIISHLLSTGGGGKERKLKQLPGSGPWKDGEHKRLVIGDKWGLDAVSLVQKKGAPEDILDQFTAHMGMELKVIHGIRNPYDNISAWVDSPKYQRMWGKGNALFMEAIRRYARFYEAADKLLKRHDHFTWRNDEFIANPRETIIALVEYLELPVVEPWLTNAVKSAYKKPNNRADKTEWPKKWVANVDRRIIKRWPEYFERYER